MCSWQERQPLGQLLDGHATIAFGRNDDSHSRRNASKQALHFDLLIIVAGARRSGGLRPSAPAEGSALKCSLVAVRHVAASCPLGESAEPSASPTPEEGSVP